MTGNPSSVTWYINFYEMNKRESLFSYFNLKCPHFILRLRGKRSTKQKAQT
jgi:hypothetical protein